MSVPQTSCFMNHVDSRIDPDDGCRNCPSFDECSSNFQRKTKDKQQTPATACYSTTAVSAFRPARSSAFRRVDLPLLAVPDLTNPKLRKMFAGICAAATATVGESATFKKRSPNRKKKYLFGITSMVTMPRTGELLGHELGFILKRGLSCDSSHVFRPSSRWLLPVFAAASMRMTLF